MGSLFGYFLGVAAAPHFLTYLGGSLILVSTAVVCLASNKREEMERGRTVAVAEMEAVFMGRLDDGNNESALSDPERRRLLET